MFAAYIGNNIMNNSGLCENLPSLIVLASIVPVTSNNCQAKFAEVKNKIFASQRVNPEYLQWLVGLSDGDGSFPIVNYGKYFNII